ncbi:U-box domain-containing protein 1-like [Phalaenopsis equestris]|uniref:U-box domain-containing protein 1-like n=1 Tax=Phalaenopsis equestris TaxID=78828 RepID=UPI0009E2E560|nr:U-box domain-containing protein 1-like [Phalaenopsis equestris]
MNPLLHPPPPEPTAGVPLSGLLPPDSLIESLLQSSADLTAFDSLPLLQTRNTTAAVARARLISSFLEDLHDSTRRSSGRSLPPSSILCLTELYSVIRRTKSLLNDLSSGSALWTLLNAESFAKRFLSSTNELMAALDILPLSLLPISQDIREQIELLHRQTKRAATAGGGAFVDSRETHLREELLCIMAKEKGFLDFNKVEEIMSRLGLRTAAAYQEEIKRLESEILKQAGTGGLMAVSNINNLISFVSYCKNIIFRCSQTDPIPKVLSRSSSWSVATSQPIVNTIPDEFRCPITLDLMKDPVVLASGHTYDRSSISRWLKSGHQTCPKSGQKLSHMALIPNYNLKSLVEQWCTEHNFSPTPSHRPPNTAVVTTDHISETRAAIEAVRMTAEFLVGKLAMGSPETQRQAAYELRLLAKSGMDNRRIIAEAGAIPFLVTLLGSRDPRTQENAVTALLNLSIFENNKTLIMAAGAIESIVKVLRDGEMMEARENAAATIFSLSILNECKVQIGKRVEAVVGLVELLKQGTPAGKRDAATALLNLAVYDPNKAAVVAAGAGPGLELLMDEKAGITDEALAVLAVLCDCREGMRVIGESKVVVAIMVDLMRFGSEKGKENAIAVLMGLCKDGGAEMGRRLLMNARSVPSLQSLAASGSMRARRKANALLRLLNRCFSQSNSAPA